MTDSLSNKVHSWVCEKKTEVDFFSILNCSIDVKERKALLRDVEGISVYLLSETKLMNDIKSCSSSKDTPKTPSMYPLLRSCTGL